MNLINGCPVTAEDLNIAQDIFGQDIGTLKGKTTRQKPLPTVRDYVEIPDKLMKRQHDVHLAMDNLTICGLKFLTTVSKRIKYRTCSPVLTSQASAYLETLLEVLYLYEHAGLSVTELSCDQEFKPVVKLLYGTDERWSRITPNYTPSQAHEPTAERNNRTIQERFRAIFHRLPFEAIPKIMITYLAMECARKLNYFPPKNGVSSEFSPRMILSKKLLDYQLHCAVAFGTYVQAQDDPNPKNTNDERTVSGIYLRAESGSNGGHEVMRLTTGRAIT